MATDLLLSIAFLFLFVGLGLILAYWYIKYRKLEGGDKMEKKKLEILRTQIEIRDSLTREIAKGLTELYRELEDLPRIKF